MKGKKKSTKTLKQRILENRCCRECKIKTVQVLEYILFPELQNQTGSQYTLLATGFCSALGANGNEIGFLLRKVYETWTGETVLMK